jgi:hypothetical protein
MLSRFEKGSVVVVKAGVSLPFRYSRRLGLVQFAYDHEPPAYDVEFFWCGRSLGVHYFEDDELEPFHWTKAETFLTPTDLEAIQGPEENPTPSKPKLYSPERHAAFETL